MTHKLPGEFLGIMVFVKPPVKRKGRTIELRLRRLWWICIQSVLHLDRPVIAACWIEAQWPHTKLNINPGNNHIISEEVSCCGHRGGRRRGMSLMSPKHTVLQTLPAQIQATWSQKKAQRGLDYNRCWPCDQLNALYCSLIKSENNIPICVNNLSFMKRHRKRTLTSPFFFSSQHISHHHHSVVVHRVMLNII